jgi:hypothetical protein
MWWEEGTVSGWAERRKRMMLWAGRWKRIERL